MPGRLIRFLGRTDFAAGGCSCVVCDNARTDKSFPVCDDCLPAIYRVSSMLCRTCGSEINLCTCSGIKVVSLFWYEGNAATKIIYSLKHSLDWQRLAFFVSLLADRIGSMATKDFDAVTCVPSRRRTMLKYGYGHAEVIAQELADKLGLPFVKTLERQGDRQQKLLSALQRRQSLKNSFRLLDSDTELSKYRRILLIDDVTTTGATLSCCAAILRRAGVGQIVCATIAKTMKEKQPK